MVINNLKPSLFPMLLVLTVVLVITQVTLAARVLTTTETDNKKQSDVYHKQNIEVGIPFVGKVNFGGHSFNPSSGIGGIGSNIGGGDDNVGGGGDDNTGGAADTNIGSGGNDNVGGGGNVNIGSGGGNDAGNDIGGSGFTGGAGYRRRYVPSFDDDSIIPYPGYEVPISNP